jgi:hypothetical protein
MKETQPLNFTEEEALSKILNYLPNRRRDPLNLHNYEDELFW